MTTPAEIEEILKESRKLIGWETEPIKAQHPVEYEPLRRWCHMADNANPLFFDAQYARKTDYGEVICPPGAVALHFRPSYSTWPPLPGREAGPLPSDFEVGPFPRDIPMPEGCAKGFALSMEWQFLKPVKVGDWLSYKKRIGDIFIKGIRFDPQAFWIAMDDVYLNEAGEEVAISRNTVVYFRRAEQLKKDGVTGYPR